jgi:protein disulfide-isomerase
MKRLLLTGWIFAAALVASAAVKVGDSYDAVIAAKGKPLGKMELGQTVLLQYADQTIKLKGGKVIALEVAKVSVVPAPAPGRTVSMASTAVPVSAPRAKESTWITDYDSALAQARDQDRHVFLFFTGSDWCGWCMKLNKEILSTPEFVKYAGDNLVLVELDFPRRKQLSPTLVAQNRKLAQRFHIEGYPTVIVLNKEGNPVGELGYEEGGPQPFIDRLRQM